MVKLMQSENCESFEDNDSSSSSFDIQTIYCCGCSMALGVELMISRDPSKEHLRNDVMMSSGS